jgi:hypothetical protein
MIGSRTVEKCGLVIGIDDEERLCCGYGGVDLMRDGPDFRALLAQRHDGEGVKRDGEASGERERDRQAQFWRELGRLVPAEPRG